MEKDKEKPKEKKVSDKEELTTLNDLLIKHIRQGIVLQSDGNKWQIRWRSIQSLELKEVLRELLEIL